MSEAIVSINGKVMGDLDDLVKQPTEEFKEAMRGLVERAMPPTQPISQELAFKSGFDYRQIDEQHRDEVKAAANSIKQLGRAMHSSRLAIGKQLIEVKGMLPYGQFCAWIDAEFQLSERTAQNIMNAARLYGDGRSEIIAVLSDTVLYMLAAPSTPEEARVEVEQAAAGGQKITVEFAKETIQKRKPAPVSYTPIYQLEQAVREWLNRNIGEGGTPDIDSVLDSLKTQANQPLKDESWLDLLDRAIKNEGTAFRSGDLAQAINNVRDQRKQARRQAGARTVYTEPAAEPEIVLDNMVWEWVGKHASETTHTPLAILEFLDEGKTTRAAKERRQLGAWLREQGVEWRVDDDLSQAIKRVRTRREQQANQASAKVVYLGSEVDQSVMRLLTLDMRSDAFNALLLTASIEQLHEALKRIPPVTEKERYLKIGNRRQLLTLAQDAAHVDELIEAAMPSQATPLEQAIAEAIPDNLSRRIVDDYDVPPDLKRYGYYLQDFGNTWGWASRNGGGCGPDTSRDQAIENARSRLASENWVGRLLVDPKVTPEARQRAILGILVNGIPTDINFHCALENATADQLTEALDKIPAESNKVKREKIGVQLRKLEREQAKPANDHWVAGQTIEELATLAEPDIPADPDPIMPDDLAEAGFTFVRVGKGMWAVELDNLREPYVSNWCFDPMDAVEDARAYLATLAPSTPPAPTVMPDDLIAAGYTLIDTKPGPGWCWHKGSGKTYASGPSLEHNNGVAISPEAAIADARRHFERSGGKLPKVATEASSSTVTLIFDRAIAEALHAALLIQDVKRGMTPGQRSIAEKAFGKALGL